MSLYSHSPESVLYQEMLSCKASINLSKDTDDFSSGDWDILSGDNYDGDSEASSLSNPSEGEGKGDDLTPMSSAPKLLPRKDGNEGGGGKGGTLTRNGPNRSFQEDIEVEYHTPRGFSRSYEEWTEKEADHKEPFVTPDDGGGGGGASSGKPHLHRGHHIKPKVNVLHVRRLSSMEYLSSSAGADDHRSYLTPGGGDEDSAGEMDVDFHQSQHHHHTRREMEEKETRRDQIILRQHSQRIGRTWMSPERGGVGMANQSVASPGVGLRRGGSMQVRGERAGTVLMRGNLQPVSQSTSSSQ